jgi:2',3'-cyclic-nucleotide 2'-phosphodiesterase (5'-nucleotidase family)
MTKEVEGDFPTYVTNKNGQVVPVVQVYKYSKYLGHLKLSFDEYGEILNSVDGFGVSKVDVIPIDNSLVELNV